MPDKPFIARFMDGRDASGIPWETSGPNSPVFVDRFIEFEFSPYVFAKDGSILRMLPSNGSISPYRLEMADDAPGADILTKGFTVSESEAIALL